MGHYAFWVRWTEVTGNMIYMMFFSVDWNHVLWALCRIQLLRYFFNRKRVIMTNDLPKKELFHFPNPESLITCLIVVSVSNTDFMAERRKSFFFQPKPLSPRAKVNCKSFPVILPCRRQCFLWISKNRLDRVVINSDSYDAGQINICKRRDQELWRDVNCGTTWWCVTAHGGEVTRKLTSGFI